MVVCITSINVHSVFAPFDKKVPFSVGGCGQQNSMEAVSLVDLESGWSPRPSMSTRRFVPGVGVLDEKIYVVGGADSNWIADKTVEMFDTSTYSIHYIDTVQLAIGIHTMYLHMYVFCTTCTQ